MYFLFYSIIFGHDKDEWYSDCKLVRTQKTMTVTVLRYHPSTRQYQIPIPIPKYLRAVCLWVEVQIRNLQQ